MAESPLGYAQSGALAASTLVSSLTFGSATAAGIPEGTQLLIIQCETAAVRWRDDGVAPTAAIGYPLAIGQELRYTAHGQQNLRFIGQTGTAIIDVTAYAGS